MPEEGSPVSKEKKVRTKEKKQRTGRKHESLKVWEYYEVKDGGLSRKRDNCPRCGPGTFLSKHDKRLYCGRCGFTQFQKSGASAQPEPGKAEEGKPEEAPTEEGPAEEKKGEAASEEEKSEDGKEDAEKKDSEQA